MRNMLAVFLKQFTIVLRMPTLLGVGGFFLILVIAFSLLIEDAHPSIMVNQFAVVILGMQLIMSTVSYIHEDKSSMNLRFMSMGGVKPWQYCVGTWLAMMISAVIIMFIYAIARLDFGVNTLWFLLFTFIAASISALLGITVGISKIPHLTMPMAVLLGFGPMLSSMNEDLEKYFRFAFTDQLRLVLNNFAVLVEDEITEHICEYCGEIVLCAEEYVNGYANGAGFRTAEIREALLIMLANGAVVLGLFIFMHRKHGLHAPPSKSNPGGMI